MKAYNAKKTPKEHWLFVKRGRCLQLVNKDGISAIVKRDRKLGENIVYCKDGQDFFYATMEQCLQVLKYNPNSIGNSIKTIERQFGISIKDVGLSRKDFSNNLKNIDYILECIAMKK